MSIEHVAAAGPSRLLEWSIVALPVAAVVAVDPAGWYPFGPAKWLAITVVLATLVIGLGRRAQWTIPHLPVLLWLALLVLVIASAAFGRDQLYAWIGTPERNFGVVTWVLLMVCFLAGSQLVGDGITLLARSVTVAGLWTGGYSLSEFVWRAPIGVDADTVRLGGPFGSPAYLGAATCLLIPVAVAVAVDARSPVGWRVAGGAAASTCTVALLGSGTRAAWCGLAISAVAVAAAAGHGRLRSRWILGVAALAVVLVAMSARLPEVLDRSAGATSRLAEWRVAADVIAERPLLGVGPEGYRIAFGGAVDADYERAHGRDPLPDRAHSGPLDVAAMAGVPAGMLYVALLVCVAWSALATARRAERTVAVGIAGATIAYAVQQLVFFPVYELDSAFWVMAGATVTLGARSGALRLVRPTGRHVVAAAGIGLAALGVIAGVLGVAADRLARQATMAVDPVAAADAAARAATLRPDVVRYRLLESAALEASGTLAATDAATVAAERALDVSPADPIIRHRRAELLTRRAEITGDPTDTAGAVSAWTMLVAGDPSCFDCWLRLGQSRALSDDERGAEVAWAAADRLTESDARPASLLALLYAQQGRVEAASTMAARARALTEGT